MGHPQEPAEPSRAEPVEPEVSEKLPPPAEPTRPSPAGRTPIAAVKFVTSEPNPVPFSLALKI